VRARRRQQPSRRLRIRRVGLLAVVLAIVWGYDTGSAVATVVTHKAPAVAPQTAPQAHVSVIPTYVTTVVVLE